MKKRGSLLSVGSDAKTVKGEKLGITTGILYLAPADVASEATGRNVNMCPQSSAGCREACLYRSGRAQSYPSILRARIAKTVEFLTEKSAFRAELIRSIGALERKAKREGTRPAVRLNGTSDIPWETIAPELFASFPGVTFYEYTKLRTRYGSWLLHGNAPEGNRTRFPRNLHLTFSRSEDTPDSDVIAILANGGTVTVPYIGASFAVARDAFATRFGIAPDRVISGDDSDARFLDAPGSLVILKAKGRLGKSDRSGFVVRLGKDGGR